MRPSPADRIAIVVATGLGTGYGPLVPGTWGSIPGVALGWLVERRAGGWGVAAAACVAALFGTWAAGRAERYWGEKDPGRVVVDEIAGQLVTLCFLPATPQVLLAGFVVFRVFGAGGGGATCSGHDTDTLAFIDVPDLAIPVNDTHVSRPL